MRARANNLTGARILVVVIGTEFQSTIFSLNRIFVEYRLKRQTCNLRECFRDVGVNKMLLEQVKH